MIFLIPIRYWAETQLETESGPAAASLSHSRAALPAGLPQPRPSSPADSPPVHARSRPSLPCSPAQPAWRALLTGSEAEPDTEFIPAQCSSTRVYPLSKIHCDLTCLLQIGDRIEFISASATSRWIPPYK
jgi:hypothetical protein